MRVSYVSPTNYKLIDFYEIENEKERNIDVKRNRRSDSGYSSRQGENGGQYSQNDSRLSKDGGTTEENAGVSQSQSERNGRGYSRRTDVHNGQTETSEAETLIKKFSLKEDVDFGIDDESIAEYNEVRLPKKQYARLSSAIMQKHTNETYSIYVKKYALLSDGSYTYLYKSPSDFIVVGYKKFIEKDYRRLNDERVHRNRNNANGYSDRLQESGQRRQSFNNDVFGNGRKYAKNDRISQRQSEGKQKSDFESKRLSQRNSQDETELLQSYEIEKLSLLDDVEIETAKEAYERNRKLQVDTKLVRKLFKDAGTVLDKSKTDAIANTLADRYEVTNPKYRELLSDKLYAYYTYVAKGNASEAQTAIYGYELAKDIAAMSDVSEDNKSDNFFEEYGESIYDVISLDIAREYAEKAIIKAPKELEQEHKEIADEYRKIKDSGGDTKAIYKALKDKTEELVGARKQYAKSRSEVMELRELLKKTQRFYERKLSKKKASVKAKTIADRNIPQIRPSLLERLPLLNEHLSVTVENADMDGQPEKSFRLAVPTQHGMSVL